MILGSFRGNGTPDLWGACDKLRGATDSVPLFAYVNPIRVHRCRGGSLAVGMGWGISVNQPPKMTNKYIWAKKNKRKTKKLSRHLSLRGRIVEESFAEERKRVNDVCAGANISRVQPEHTWNTADCCIAFPSHQIPSSWVARLHSLAH